ncbi:hypothetical protein RISK_005465 [Rhodopirellula islandica]|uniref:Uncharacterized protein n=1 Tax=Rhodopirellula islandica TaxID=595434 RepID=A0A0J1EA95_RHOIS|nr:hypothetical protein RISK_005465 [Rhodopirellula islandica]
MQWTDPRRFLGLNTRPRCLTGKSIGFLLMARMFIRSSFCLTVAYV